MYETGSAITATGALTAYSGAKTGRSPLDKRIVKEESSEKNVWWGPVNKPMSPQVSAPPKRRICVFACSRGDAGKDLHDSFRASAFAPRFFLVM